MFRPMLAGEAALQHLKFPIYASPKLDGVRAIVREGVVYSRSNKPIPNQYVQKAFSGFEHYDGELIVGEPTAHDCYRQTVSTVMSQSPLITTFHAFDHVGMPFTPFNHRLGQLEPAANLQVLEQKLIQNMEDLLRYEAKLLNLGYEGLILRAPHAPYKMGRSSMREGYLLKLKRFTDAEFAVVGFEERMHNGNEATTNELGRTARSSHQANKTGRGDLGALICQYGDTTFNVGTGFDDAERVEIWENRDKYLGATAKVKFFMVGMKDLPRHPVFLGWRRGD